MLCFFLCPAFFSRISSFFFSLFCFTAYPFSINCFLFARDFQQLFLQFFHLFIYFFVATDPQEPNDQYEEGNSFGDIYACFTSNKR